MASSMMSITSPEAALSASDFTNVIVFIWRLWERFQEIGHRFVEINDFETKINDFGYISSKFSKSNIINNAQKMVDAIEVEVTNMRGL